MPTRATAPNAHEAACRCDAVPAGLADGDAAAPAPLGLVALDVPLGFPDMFSWEIAMFVLLTQWLALSAIGPVRRVTSVHLMMLAFLPCHVAWNREARILCDGGICTDLVESAATVRVRYDLESRLCSIADVQAAGDVDSSNAEVA